MKLFRVAHRIRPAVCHPKYWDWQFGILLVYVLAESPNDAVDKAITIIEVLPYELVGDNVQVVTIEGPDKRPELQNCEENARVCSLSVFLIAAPTGADEENLESPDFFT